MKKFCNCFIVFLISIFGFIGSVKAQLSISELTGLDKRNGETNAYELTAGSHSSLGVTITGCPSGSCKKEKFNVELTGFKYEQHLDKGTLLADLGDAESDGDKLYNKKANGSGKISYKLYTHSTVGSFNMKISLASNSSYYINIKVYTLPISNCTFNINSGSSSNSASKEKSVTLSLTDSLCTNEKFQWTIDDATDRKYVHFEDSWPSNKWGHTGDKATVVVDSTESAKVTITAKARTSGFSKSITININGYSGTTVIDSFDGLQISEAYTGDVFYLYVRPRMSDGSYYDADKCPVVVKTKTNLIGITTKVEKEEYYLYVSLNVGSSSGTETLEFRSDCIEGGVLTHNIVIKQDPENSEQPQQPTEDELSSIKNLNFDSDSIVVPIDGEGTLKYTVSNFWKFFDNYTTDVYVNNNLIIGSQYSNDNFEINVQHGWISIKGLAQTDSESTIKACVTGTEVCDTASFIVGKEKSSGKKGSRVTTLPSPKIKEVLNYSEVETCKNKNVISVLKVVGYCITIIKIVLPVILVIVSCKSLALAVINENDELKVKTKAIITKIILAVIIFLVPTLMRTIYDAALSNSENNPYQSCVDCVLDTKSCPTTGLYCLDSKGEKDDIYVLCDSGIGGSQNNNCTGTFGDTTDPDSLAYYLQMALDIMRWAGLILCILLSIVDVLKAVFGEDKEMQKKVAGNIIKRISYCIILIFLPTLIETIFEMFGLYGTCGIK